MLLHRVELAMDKLKKWKEKEKETSRLVEDGRKG